ncbi:guanine nucleotide binding protein beta subunit, variant 2 [Coprinopsis cinerea AmutBmut pab1-1]|nr:guanine nucleotide binding protein beta subunit, variant 2 [Coprinopsis cinerea AmutBmut pab1-1]
MTMPSLVLQEETVQSSFGTSRLEPQSADCQDTWARFMQSSSMKTQASSPVVRMIQPSVSGTSGQAQSRQAIQTLEEARDTIQTLHVGPTFVIAGSVDGHVRTYDLRKGELRSDFLGHPVTSVVPTQDATTYLVTTLDNHVRLMDMGTGKMLNDFSGHSNESYRCRACFGYGEATVLCGDEKGLIWAWDLLDAKVMPPNPPPKAHHKVVTWTEHHPIDMSEYVTASADGTVKVWKAPSTDSTE